MQRPAARTYKFSPMRRTPSAGRNVAVPNQARRHNRNFVMGCVVCVALLFASFVAQPLQATVVITRYAYVADPGAGQILEYSINSSTGVLAPIKGCASAADPNSPSDVIVDKTGSFLYVANTAANDIWAYAINPATGCLVTPATSYPTLGKGPVALDIAAHDGIMFVSDGGSAQIDAFTVTSGVLVPIGGSPFTGCPNAAGIAVDLIESYVYLASNVSSNGGDSGTGVVCGFEYSLGGKQWMSGPTSYATTGAYPTRLVYDSVGQFLFVTNSGANTVESFNVSTTGVLTANNTVATGTSPAGVGVNPFGQQVFVANNGANSISSFQIEVTPTYGSLAANGAAIASGSEPAGLAVDQSGRFVYVADKGGFINGYTINASTGKLATIKGSPWATPGTGTSPVAIATQP